MDRKVFKRKIYERLVEWKREDDGRTALLLQGARRIGKSTIVEEFAVAEYKSYILIDFNQVSNQIIKLFDDLMDLNYIFLQLQTIYGVSLHEGESLIIFDEVQRCPKARQAIKYLVKDGRYHYLETGSLISIKQNTKDISIPSEERRIDMYPMDFEEFCWAVGEGVSNALVKQFYDTKKPLGIAHRKKQRDIRLYMLVGGMPQAVNEYIVTNDLSKVDQVKRSIIQLYYDDFMKIDPTGNAGKMFLSIPAQLSNNASRYYTRKVVGDISQNSKKELLVNLEDSKTVLIAYHASDPNIGMSLTQNDNKYKLYIADTGLFVTMVFWDKGFTDNVIYQKLLSDKLEVNLGYLYENLMAQMLTSKDDKLFYYTFPKDDRHSYEIDFLITRGNKICPIEVKSSGYKTHASIDAFSQKFSNRIKDKYIVYTKDYHFGDGLVYLPFYMVQFI